MPWLSSAAACAGLGWGLTLVVDGGDDNRSQAIFAGLGLSATGRVDHGTWINSTRSD